MSQSFGAIGRQQYLVACLVEQIRKQLAHDL